MLLIDKAILLVYRLLIDKAILLLYMLLIDKADMFMFVLYRLLIDKANTFVFVVYRLLIDKANTFMFGVDTEGRVTEWNSKAKHMTGYSKRDVIGRSWIADLCGHLEDDDDKEAIQEVFYLSCIRLKHV
jgi:PAS domain-containing protein